MSLFFSKLQRLIDIPTPKVSAYGSLIKNKSTNDQQKTTDIIRKCLNQQIPKKVIDEDYVKSL